jgi:Family of unknown function (DUF5985)
MTPYDQLASVGHPVLDTFLLGVVCTSSLVAAPFFLRFWRHTHDSLFLAFVVFFVIEGANEAYVATLPHPNIGNSAVTLIRLPAVLGILSAIVFENLAER